MTYINKTTITEFVIMGFSGLQPQYYGAVSVLFFVAYLAILAGNIVILAVVFKEKALQKPTYLIFCNLAISDIAFGTTTLPKIISRYWLNDQIISFPACFLQMFIVHFLGSVNSFLLMWMALDRFVAVCNPLRYPTLITNSTIMRLCGLSWFLTMSLMVVILVQALPLPYCSSNVITQCYCDHNSITRLACEKERIVHLVAFGIAMFVLIAPLIFVIFTYIAIISSVMKITSFEGRHKMFSTCSPQLSIMCLYYLPRCFVYVASNMGFTFSADVRTILVMLYSLLPPVVNPFIYCFRTKEIKETLIRRFLVKNIKCAITPGCR